MTENLRDRLAGVNDRIARAARQAGRKAEDITLIGVSKTMSAEIVQTAVDAGMRVFGENKVQEAAEKIPAIKGAGLTWHLIGHLQSNKARTAVTIFDTIHTVDSVDLAARLNRIAEELGRKPNVLVQINVAGEATKSGAAESELRSIVDAVDSAASLRLVGLMTIPPFSDSPELSRPYFKQLRKILEQVNVLRPPDIALRELSMGMSNDFEVAIEEGATMVRVGTAIFGPRTGTIG